ncbi:MAG: alpha/beta fold hydrolase [Betaproteobacteria bacterium]
MNIVLVHGAWHGGWGWKRLAPLLRRAGHEVFMPTLTGLGERAHLAGPQVDLDAHVEDVVGVLEAEELENAMLLGHSYGGMVVTGAADRVPQRIARLVYLDAFVPENGRSLMDYVLPERGARFREEGERTGFVTPPPPSLWGITRPEDVAWLRRRETPHPFATMKQPLHLRNGAALARIPKAFIHCSSPATGSFDQFAAKYRNDPAWRIYELATGHDAMILVPGELAGILLELTKETA